VDVDDEQIDSASQARYEATSDEVRVDDDQGAMAAAKRERHRASETAQLR
jgi:hypothetical protein